MTCACETSGEAGPRVLCLPDVGNVGDPPWTAADKARDDRRIERHEAAHAVVALALGRHVEYASVMGEDPHVMQRARVDRPGWPHAALFVTLAGPLGEPEPPPHDYPDCAARVRASRARCLGGCDACKAAYFLVGFWGEGSTDDELALTWGHMRAVVLNLLGHPTIAEAIDRVAAALRRRPLLLADDLAVIVNVTALRAAAAEVLGPGERHRPSMDDGRV